MSYFHTIENYTCSNCGNSVKTKFNIMSAQPLSERQDTIDGVKFLESPNKFRLLCNCSDCHAPQIFDVELLYLLNDRGEKVKPAISEHGRQFAAYLNRLTPVVVYSKYSSPQYRSAQAFDCYDWGQPINPFVRVIGRYPEPQLENPAFLPVEVEKEFMRLHKINDPTIQIGQCRRTLETACKVYLGNQFNPKAKLNDLIYQILQSEQLTASIKNWVHHIRILGNAASHYDTTEYSEQQAQDLCQFLTLFLELLFSYPNKVEQSKSSHHA